jgi:hypothetical protein
LQIKTGFCTFLRVFLAFNFVKSSKIIYNFYIILLN